MKRWLLWIAVIAVVVVIGWYYSHRGSSGGGIFPSASTSESSSSGQSAGQAAHITWQKVERRQDGINLEMPTGPKDLQVPAYNRNGSYEQAQMMSSNPDADTTFALVWEDEPPVARENRLDPESTLEAARDGMLARTLTSVITQSQTTVAGYPALDLTAKNAGGGILDARMIYVNGRLYTLIATFPSLEARRQQDVNRFYNSFMPQAHGNGTANASS